MISPEKFGVTSKLKESLIQCQKTMSKERFEVEVSNLIHNIKSNMSSLVQFPEGVERIKNVYRILDHLHATRTDKIKDSISCKKGCAHCCHIFVAVCPSELNAIFDWVEAHPESSISEELLEIQKDLDETGYMQTPPDKSRCVFLDKEDSCSIYPVRPMACRTYHVITDPDLCDAYKHPHGSVGGVFNYMVEVLVSAMLTLESNGKLVSLAKGMWEKYSPILERMRRDGLVEKIDAKS